MGAGHLAPELLNRYGENGIELILDEGGNGPRSLPGDQDVVYALPSVGEKGSLDLVLDLAVPGGHSSIPPTHTGIGIMADIMHTLEREDLFVPLLGEGHPTREMLKCQVAHSPAHVEPWLANALSTSTKNEIEIAKKLSSSRGPKFGVTMQTTQAAVLFHGGVKASALPEKISAVVNYRVALHESPDTVIDRAIHLITPIVQGYNLSFSHSFSPLSSSSSSEATGDNAINYLTLKPLAAPLVPAPISPTSADDRTWTCFAGVVRSVFESVPSLKGKKVVAGDSMTGNTDTRFYWALSRNIYRWNPLRDAFDENIRTVDEKQLIDTHLEGIMMYYGMSSTL